MIHGHGTRLFIENGPEEQAQRVQASRSTARSWRALDARRRLALVEQALKPANDIVDEYLIAL